MDDLTPAQLSAPRPWLLIDESMKAHPSVSIGSPGRESPVAFKYAPLPHEVADFAHMVDCVNAMAGIPDPAAYVAAMGACVEAGAGFVAALTSDGENRHGSITVDHVRLTACIAVMEAALATARATMEKVNG